MQLRSFDRVASIYDGTRAIPAVPLAAIAARLVALAGAGPSPRILEVGVGTGRIAAPLAAAGARVTGIDISREMVRVLRARPERVDLVLAEAARQPFRPAVFDAALFVHILHLVPDPAATIEASIRAVRPGGVLLACATRQAPGGSQAANAHLRDVAARVSGLSLAGAGSRNHEATERARATFEAHASAIEEHEIARWPTATTARQLLDEFVSQTHSWTWDIDPAAIHEAARAAAPALEKLSRGLDAPLHDEAIFSATVVRLP